jgi:hypothetical protein
MRIPTSRTRQIHAYKFARRMIHVAHTLAYKYARRMYAHAPSLICNSSFPHAYAYISLSLARSLFLTQFPCTRGLHLHTRCRVRFCKCVSQFQLKISPSLPPPSLLPPSSHLLFLSLSCALALSCSLALYFFSTDAQCFALILSPSLSPSLSVCLSFHLEHSLHLVQMHIHIHTQCIN